MALFDKKMHDPVQATARVVDNNGLASIPGQAIHCETQYGGHAR